MPEYKQAKIISSGIQSIYDLVIDIESYPDFLPWCAHTRILEKSNDKIISEMVVSFSGITEKYTTKVTTQPVKKGCAKVEINMISGPFKFLNSSWELHNKSHNTTLVEFQINFAFKSMLLEKLIGKVFSKACNKILHAFEERILTISNKKIAKK